MLSATAFVNAEEYVATDFTNLLAICADLRKKDPEKPYIITLQEGVNEGPFVFPFSHFAIRLRQASPLLRASLYAKMKDAAGSELTTWKTATLKVTGSHNLFEGLRIENNAGDPASKGQEVALAVYGDDNVFVDCVLVSTQDTLFVGPLPDDLATRYLGFIPEDERYHEGNTRNDFYHCAIFGSVDFIFGAGAAVFYQCALFSVNDGREESYVSAPAHSLKDDFGFLFHQCAFLPQGVAPQSVFLARPWRDYGKAVFHECAYENHIKKEGFAEWNSEQRYRTARFEEYPLQPSRVPWVKNKESAPLPERYQKAIAAIEDSDQRLK